MPRAQASRATSVDSAGTPTASTTVTSGQRRPGGPRSAGQAPPAVSAARRRAVGGRVVGRGAGERLVECRPADQPGTAEEDAGQEQEGDEVADAPDRRSSGPAASNNVGTTPRTIPASAARGRLRNPPTAAAATAKAT